jgi:replicative DNA helicase
LDESERDVLAVRTGTETTKLLSARELVHETIQDIETIWNNKGKLTGISTGFVDLDKMTTGMNNGEYWVIAARPSIGKSSMAMNIAEHVAVDQKLPVGIFSLEMTARSLMKRMVCSRARVNIRSVNEGFLADRDFPKLTGAAGALASAPLHFDDTSDMTILQLRARARRMKQQHGIRLFIVDYLGLLSSPGKRQENRQVEVSEISKGLKNLGKELDVPILVLVQLNRDLEKRTGDEPRLSDIRESGSIEADADLVGLLYKPKEKESEDAETREESEAVATNLLIGKQRNGPTGKICFTFLKPFTRFESAAKVQSEDVPDYKAPHKD